VAVVALAAPATASQDEPVEVLPGATSSVIAYETGPDDAKAWAELETKGEMVEALTPEDPSGVVELSPDELVDATLTYPLYFDYLFFNSPQDGFNQVRHDSEAVEALLEGPDAAALVDRYIVLDLRSSARASGEAGIQFGFLQMEVAQSEVLNAVSSATRKALLGEVLTKWSLISNELRASYSPDLCALLAARILALESPSFARSAAGIGGFDDFIASGDIHYLPADKWQRLVTLIRESSKAVVPAGIKIK
jgi:hypothetical protein